MPARVFGRVSLISCQINIYSQNYLFAFVTENSCGLFFLCVVLFPLCIFGCAALAGETAAAFAGSSRSSCFSQPIVLSLFCKEGLHWQPCSLPGHVFRPAPLSRR